MEGVKEEGLLGTGIGRSMAPMLQETLGRLTGIDVVYPSHDRPESFAPSIPSFLAGLAARGVVGINVTHPFKERVVELLTIDDPAVRAIGAVNTIRFDADGARGFNTDYSGMQAAYRARFGDARPGVLAQLGAGGFGKAAIFAMAAVGASLVRLFDPDDARAGALAARVGDAAGLRVEVCGTAEAAVEGVAGVLNCSPVGMHIHPGCPVDPSTLRGVEWVFDAIYSPLRTELLAHAEAVGAVAVSGSELFFWQGIHSFELFHRCTLERDIVDAAAAVVADEVARRSLEGR